MYKWKQKEWLNKEYWEKGKTISQISKETKISGTAIYYWIVKNKIKRRKPSAIIGYFTGKNNPQWKGGRIIDATGYVRIRNPLKKIYEAEHRLIMEKHLGRSLQSYELVHHRNAIKTDNRLENLEIILQYPKSGFHKGVMKCPHCQKDFSIM